MKITCPTAPTSAAWPPEAGHLCSRTVSGCTRFIFSTSTSAHPASATKILQQDQGRRKRFLIKGKVAEVSEDPATKNITVVAENAVTGEKIHQTVEMAVLATGMQPTAANAKLPADLKVNDDGFIINDFEKGGMFAAGCANKPADVFRPTRMRPAWP
jgi:heterodisulfide reductase subunit A-like polyferredoxin